MPEYALDPLVWLSAAALLLMVEFVFIHAIGILLIALATAVMALPVYLGVLEDANQFMFAYGFSVFFCFFFLWKPMRRFYGKQKAEQRCTAGDHAEVVLGPISKSAAGRIKYSGGEMPALLSSTDSFEELNEGDIVEVLSIQGHMAIITNSQK